MKTHSNLSRDSLLILLSLLLLHIETCQAQSSGGIYATPVVFFATLIICVCFWVCFCIQRAKQRTFHSSYPVRARGYVSTAPPGHSVNPPQTQQVYPGQGYVPPSAATVPNPSPPVPPEATPQATTSESASLTHATLHQGDAPPGYAEAIGMKTVDIAGQDEQQV
jgi:hypothetical protein